jgi:hypothetical protein
MTTINSLVNNPSNNRLSDLITMQESRGKEDSYELDPKKFTLKGIVSMKDKALKRCETASENISAKNHNDSAKFNRTMNGNISPGKINSNWKMLMNNPEFASIIDKIQIPNPNNFGIDLLNPSDFSKFRDIL